MGLEACNLLMAFEVLRMSQSADSGGKLGTDYDDYLFLQRTLASEAAIEDLMMQAKKNKYNVTELTETRRRHPLNASYETGKELFSGTSGSRGIDGVGVLVNTSMKKNIDPFEQLTTRIGLLRMRGCGPTPVLTIFVVYSPTSSCEEEVEAFYMDLEKFY
ncbi:hypothetical protein RB195_022317 [Necator americanus]|uniref:Uncharacterized protein n=1 Tax=Necator americanus TaxID=51031 RepID=A0ABR1EH29_NECAM